MKRKLKLGFASVVISSMLSFSAQAKSPAEKVYVPHGKHDEFYAFLSGGYNGQVGVYGLPSGRLLKVIPVFSVYPMNGYGYSEETKAMLNTSHGWIPWGVLTTQNYRKQMVFQMEGGFSSMIITRQG